MVRFDDDIKHNMMVNIARLYYLKRMTHQQIGQKLGLSRVKVTRLLKEVVEKRIVEFRIQDPIVNTLELQDELEQRLGLSKAVVVPSASSEAETCENLGACAADFLMKSMEDNLTIGLSWGRTMNAMIPHLKRSYKKNLNVVSVTGGLAANARQPNPYDITSSVAERLNATPHYLLIPAIVESVQIKDILLNEPSAKKVIQWWDKIDLCMVSIGMLSKYTGVFYSLEDPARQVRRTKELGGVGDIMAQPFNIKGEFLKTEFSERTITIGIERLRKIPKMFGVAGGRQKVRSVLGALRTGLLDVLITDEYCARKVLKIAEGKKTK